MLAAAPLAASEAPVESAWGAVEFWFVEANEGQSAGGHAALRIGPRVYHLEHRGDGLIADRRTSPRRFIEVYADRGNRRIEAIPLDLDDARIRTLERHLATRYFDRTRRLAALDGLEDEIRWLESVEDAGALSIKIPGLGLFEAGRKPGACSEDVAPAPRGNGAQSTLRVRLTERLGRAVLQDRQHAARLETQKQIAAILGRAEPAAELSAARNEPRGRLRALIRAARSEFALDLLFGCEGVLRPGALVRTGTPLGENRGIWMSAQAELAEDVAALLESPRTDIGLPLLLAWARFSAIAQTLATNQIHLLAPFKEHAAEESRAFTQSSASVADEVPPAWQRQREAEAAARWSRALEAFAIGDGPLEAHLLGIERAHHAIRHLKSRTLHDPIRPESRSPSPAEAYTSAARVLPWATGMRFSAVHEARLARESAAAALRRSLEGELRYGLFTRNCVTELSAALETIQAREGERQKPRLFAGDRGRLSATEVLRGAFVPEIVAFRVEEALATRARRMLPSTRERALDHAREKIETPFSRLIFEASEFITLTSRTYQTNQDDSRFLFFADGPRVIRPLIGVANLGYGVAASMIGLLEAPFDRGVGLRRGVKGIAMSVPELFFFRVRRGSYRVAPPRALTPSAGSTEIR